MGEKAKGWGTGELVPTGNGFSWRVRIGKLGRKTFPLWEKLDAGQAEQRRDVLASIRSDMLRAKAPLDRVERFLEEAARSDDATLEALLVVVAKQTEGKISEKPKAARETKPTFRQVAEDWTSGRLANTYPDHIDHKRSADMDVYRLEKHVFPHPLADKPIDQVTEADCEAVMKALSPTLRPATRRQVAQLMIRVLGLACYPLKLITHSPLPKGFLPKTGKRRALSYLYVDEDRRLMAETSIPLCYRMLWGFLAREGMRLSEAVTLTWRDVDLKRGTVKLDRNKTDDPRMWALNPGVVQALSTWRDLRDDATGAGDPVFVDVFGGPMTRKNRAEKLRKHLQVIGLDVERPELFERSDVRQPIRVHDLRATFITHSLANGKTEKWVSSRTGHASSVMISNYDRDVRCVEEIGQGELDPLNQAIPELRPAAKVGLQLGRQPHEVAATKLNESGTIVLFAP